MAAVVDAGERINCVHIEGLVSRLSTTMTHIRSGEHPLRAAHNLLHSSAIFLSLTRRPTFLLFFRPCSRS